MVVAVTDIQTLRKNGKGVHGTIANAEHHAPLIVPFIDALQEPLGKVGFATWKQGHNVHEFIAEDGRRFTLRPLVRGGAYVGVRLSLRLSRSQEVRLLDIDEPAQCKTLLRMMELLAQNEQGSVRSLVSSNVH